MISKGTFYAHYLDKYDLAEQLIDRELKFFENLLFQHFQGKRQNLSEINQMISQAVEGSRRMTILERIQLPNRKLFILELQSIYQKVYQKYLQKKGILKLYESKLRESDKMWHAVAAGTAKGRNLQPAYVDVEVEGLTLGDFLVFNQSLNKMTEPALPFRIHSEHCVFAGIHGGQEVMEMVGQYGEPTYQKLFIHTNAEKPVELDPDTKMAMVGDGVLMSDQTLDMKMYGMHQFKLRKNGLGIKLGVFFPETAPKEMILGHQEHLVVEFYNSLTFAYQMKSFKGKILNTILKFKKFA